MSHSLLRQGRHRLAIVGVLLWLTAACSVDPLRQGEALRTEALPTLALPQQFIETEASSTSNSLDTAWIKTFNDPELETLVSEALAHNPDNRVMAARRAQAESLIDMASGAYWPGINAYGKTGGKVGADGSGMYGYYIGAGWELDLWGRVRNAVAASEQSAQAIRADQDAARLSLLATLAKSLWLARGLQEQARLRDENAEAASDIVHLTEIRQRIGAASANDVDQARSLAAQLHEAAAATQQSRDQALRAIQILIGRYPTAIPLSTTMLPKLPPPLAPGLPAALLERRPDVVAAEARVNSAFYAAQEKRLARLPKISLTAGFGFINSQVFSLVNGPATSFGIGANALLPIFQGGSLEAKVAYQNAEAQAALGNYAKVVLNALNDVENGLSGERRWRERLKQHQEKLSTEQRIQQSTAREQLIGRIDQRQVKQQVINTNNARAAYTQAQVDALSQRINLLLALGGSATND